MFCILWGSDVSNWSENIAETKFWELVEHAAQFLKGHGAPICETQALFKICLFLCCPSLWPIAGDLEERNKQWNAAFFSLTAVLIFWYEDQVC